MKLSTFITLERETKNCRVLRRLTATIFKIIKVKTMGNLFAAKQTDWHYFQVLYARAQH